MPVVGLLLWRHAADELRRRASWWVALLVLALVAVHVGHMFAVRNEGWGTTRRATVAALLWRPTCGSTAGSTSATSGFPLSSRCWPRSAWAATRFRRERLALALYFALFFGMFLLFYAGSYNYGADVRYSLMTYPPLAILGGLGAARVAALARAGWTPCGPPHAGW